MPNDTTQPRVARRTVVAGAAWTIPVIATAAAAPAHAASCVGVCYTLDWDSPTQGFVGDAGATTANWTRTGSVAPPSGSGACNTTLGVTAAQNRVGGVSLGHNSSGTTFRTDTGGDFSIGTIAEPQVTPPTPVVNAEPGLVLAQARTAPSDNQLEYVTFTFDTAVSTVSFTIHDLSSQTNVTSGTYYIDQVAFDKPATVTATGTVASIRTSLDATAATTKTTSAASATLTNYFYRSGNNPSLSNNYDVNVQLAVNGTSFTLAYASPTQNEGTSKPYNRQWIVIGDMTICTP